MLALSPCVVGADETVAVLPLSNAGQSRNLDWVGYSLGEALLRSFSAAGATVVPPQDRDQVLSEMGVAKFALLTRASAMEIAVNLNASQVVYGEFEVKPAPAGTSGSKGVLSLTCHVVDVRRVRRLGAFQESGPLEELSSLQQLVSWKALGVAMPRLAVTEEEFRRSNPAVRLDALESYVRGLMATAPDQKHKLLATAARLAPGFSAPCFELGRLNLFALKNYPAAAEWLQKVASTDFHYREALFYLGVARLRTGEFQAAAEVLRKLADEVPLPEVLNNLGVARTRLNDPAAAELFRKAIESNPSDPDLHFNAGYALWRQSAFADAVEEFRASLQRHPEDESATLMLGRCLKQQPYRAGDLKTEGLERVKTEYNESAWLALKAMMAPKQER
ncbi:MAG: tetratricopeptide repeat protein [Acidobacteria bacterium]|nr:tetratricopeptide repeat protein [Acidobacteriota bacterium]